MDKRKINFICMRNRNNESCISKTLDYTKNQLLRVMIKFEELPGNSVTKMFSVVMLVIGF